MIPDGKRLSATGGDARLSEIAENLHRAELSALERDELVAEWVALTGEKLTQPVSVSPPKGGRGKTGGINAASRELGVNREDARRAVKVASLSPRAKAVAKELGLDDNRKLLLGAMRRSARAAKE